MRLLRNLRRPDDHGPAEPCYRSRPYVCGALGAWDRSVLRRVRRASPGPLHRIFETPLATVWASAPAPGARRATLGVYTWGSLAEGGSAATWRQAAEQRLAAGLWSAPEGGEAVLHTDALGMQDLYVRRHGDALYFAVRIDPLLDLTPDPLHTDWPAWASTLALTAPLEEHTPFLEVRRMSAATAWRAGPGTLTPQEYQPAAFDAEPDQRISAAEVVGIIGDHLPAGDRPMAVALSGGWDSRLLAALAARRWPGMLAWTTSPDDGRDLDLAYAPPVAAALGLSHRVVLPNEEAWLEDHPTVFHRTGYQTPHHVWQRPLARVLHSRPEGVVDGLAGDVLFKSLFVGPEAVASGDPAAWQALVWENLTQNRLTRPDLLAPTVAEAVEGHSREAFRRAASRFDGHPAAATLTVLRTRTARAIAPSPLWLLAPEAEVMVPFLHPAVVNAALRVPLPAKIGGGFYRDLLHAADAAVAALPSTNDAPPRGERGPRRCATPGALQAVAGHIRAHELVRQLLAPKLRRALDDPDRLAAFGRRTAPLRVLQWAGLLGQWRSRYGHRLADSDSPIM